MCVYICMFVCMYVCEVIFYYIKQLHLTFFLFIFSYEYIKMVLHRCNCFTLIAIHR